jgi:ribosomal-protein-alanine N-acetyltransferase
MITLETERLILRPYEEADLPEYHRLMSDRKNMYYLDDIATDTLEESKESLMQAIALNTCNKVRRFCVAIKETGKLIGACGYDITDETPVGRIGHMGWFILPEHQNRGYITDAAKRVLAFAFLEDNCVRITTGCYKDNIPTQRVMAKAGFRKEAESNQWHDGRMKTRLGFAINKKEYMEATH